MNDLRSRVAYLHGLAEGLDLDTGSVEGRVLAGVLDVLGDLAEEISDVNEAQDELADYVEEMDEDLSAIEESVYDGEEIVFVPEEAVLEEEDGITLVNCPECGETLAAEAGQMEPDEPDVTCPVCGCSLQTSDAMD